MIPPHHVLEQNLAERIESKLRIKITEHILREAKLDDQVTAAIAAIKTPDGAKLARDIAQLFKRQPGAEWRNHIEAIATRKVRT